MIGVEWIGEGLQRHGVNHGDQRDLWRLRERVLKLGIFGPDAPQIGDSLVVIFDHGLDPLPAFGADGFDGGLQLLVGKPVEKFRIREETTLLRVEQVAENCTASLLVRFQPDEQGARVGGGDILLGERREDAFAVALPVREVVPHPLLPRMVVADREGGERVEVHFFVAVGPGAKEQQGPPSGDRIVSHLIRTSENAEQRGTFMCLPCAYQGTWNLSEANGIREKIR